jgi:hypothetical protein
VVRTLRGWAVAFAATLAPALAACSPAPAPPCGAIVEAIPEITVTDSVTGESICDATVTAQCNDAGATLHPFGPKGFRIDAAVPGCKYGPGIQTLYKCTVFTVTIAKSGYRTQVLTDIEARFSKSCPGPVPEPQVTSVKLVPN